MITMYENDVKSIAYDKICEIVKERQKDDPKSDSAIVDKINGVSVIVEEFLKDG